MNKKLNVATIVLLTSISIPAGLWVMSGVSAHGNAIVESITNPQTETNTTAKATIDTVQIDAKIKELIAANPNLDISVSLTDLSSGTNYNYGDDSAYVAASITKLLTASLYLHEVESGNHSLTEIVGGTTAKAQIKTMIVDSDNDAWHNLNDILGDGNLNSYATSLGINSYNAADNTISSKDVALLLTKLHGNALLNDTNTTLLMSYMKDASESEYIKTAAVADGATVYHKVGYLSDRLHDAAIIEDGDNAYVLVIFSKSEGTYDFAQGQQLFNAITKTADTTFLQKA